VSVKIGIGCNFTKLVLSALHAPLWLPIFQHTVWSAISAHRITPPSVIRRASLLTTE